MAPWTRSATAGAAAACHLLDLSHDVLSIVTHDLASNPLQPLLAVHLGSTAKGLWVPMQEQLTELKQRHAEAVAFAVEIGMTFAQLADAKKLELGNANDKLTTLANWKTLGMLIGCKSLPMLEDLEIWGNWAHGGEGVLSLADGIRRGGLPALREIALFDSEIGPDGANVLASALTKRASLTVLYLNGNPLGDAGLAALLPALRQLPLEGLYLSATGIGDEGVGSLVAQPTANALGSLLELDLGENRITDDGCDTLASALRCGALPALKALRLDDVELDGNPASKEAMEAVLAARAGLREIV